MEPSTRSKNFLPDIAEHEFNSLKNYSVTHLPAVFRLVITHPTIKMIKPVCLSPQFLENSIPYRSLFMSPGLSRYRESLLDAIAKPSRSVTSGWCLLGDVHYQIRYIRRDANTLPGISG